MTEKSSVERDQASTTGEPGPIHSYEPPRVERLGSLRDLAGKSKDKPGNQNDPHTLEDRM
jgi:hypothetical protein